MGAGFLDQNSFHVTVLVNFLQSALICVVLGIGVLMAKFSPLLSSFSVGLSMITEEKLNIGDT
jgi:hypothetical protein